MTGRSAAAVALILIALIATQITSAALFTGDVSFDFPIGDDPSSPTSSNYSFGNQTFVGWSVPSYGDFLSPDYGLSLHTGEDWNGAGGGDTDFGQPVYAAGSRRVIFAGDGGCSWGLIVIIEHRPPFGSFLLPDGRLVDRVWTQYAHLSQIDESIVERASRDNSLFRGEKIGAIGRNYLCQRDANGNLIRIPGFAHLHSEVRTPSPDGDPPEWPFPANYWPSSNGKDAAWVHARYVDATDFINSNRALVPQTRTQLYDAFTASITSAKWSNSEISLPNFVRRVESGRLSIFQASVIPGPPFNNSLVFVAPSAVRALQADVTVPSSAPGSVARIFGLWYGTVNNVDVLAQTHIVNYDGTLRVQVVVSRCDDASCVSAQNIFTEHILNTTPGRTHRLYLEWTGSVFRGGVDGTIRTIDPRAILPVIKTTPSSPVKFIGTRLFGSSTSSISATFDNVFVNR